MLSTSSYNHHLQSCYLENQAISISTTSNIEMTQFGETTPFNRLDKHNKTFRINCISRKIQILKIYHAIEKSAIANKFDSFISHSSFYSLPSLHISTMKRHMSNRIQIVLAEGAEQNLNSLIANSIPS